MILLDTDHINILQIGRGQLFEKLSSRMDTSGDQHFVATVVTLQYSSPPTPETFNKFPA